MGDLSVTEHEHRLAFAERQHEHFRLRVIQAQIEAQAAIARGRVEEVDRKLDVARNYLGYMAECNDTIDTHRRAVLRVGEEPK